MVVAEFAQSSIVAGAAHFALQIRRFLSFKHESRFSTQPAFWTCNSPVNDDEVPKWPVEPRTTGEVLVWLCMDAVSRELRD